MQLGANDQHWIFSKQARTCHAFDASGKLIFSCEARNVTTNEGSFGHNGNLPYGEYVFGTPIRKDTPPFGPWAVPILDAPGHHELASRGRSGLMMHGGGSGLPDPQADHQSPPWVVTHGCERVINHDLKIAVGLIQQAHHAGGICYVTNQAPLPGAAPGAEPDDWAPATELAPDE